MSSPCVSVCPKCNMLRPRNAYFFLKRCSSACALCPESRLLDLSERFQDRATVETVVSGSPSTLRCRWGRVRNHRLHRDRKSTRLNSSHGYISYAVFCLKKKK